MNDQLPLSLQISTQMNFDNYMSDVNEQLIYSLKNKEEQFIYLWGELDLGKSHLLQAITHYYRDHQLSALYLPLKLDGQFTPEIFEGLEQMDLVCLDDIHQVLGNALWEEALFHFFNRIRESGGRLIVASDRNTTHLDISLADLKSRLTWGITYQMCALSDLNKSMIVQLQAKERGLELNTEVVSYLFKHVSRNLTVLIELLVKLDYESLAAQRKLTIPFIKQYL